MFETAELGRKISKQDFKKRAPVLREELLELRDELRALGRPQVTLLIRESSTRP